MKKRILILLIIGLFIPSFVFAHEANTKVNVDVFYKVEDDEYNTLMQALDELSKETETKDLFKVVIHSYSEDLSKKAYKYALSENKDDLLVFIDYYYNIGFAESKYLSTDTKKVSSLYNYYKNYLKNKIIDGYKRTSLTLVEELESGYFDSYLDGKEETTIPNFEDPTKVNYSEDDLDVFTNELKEIFNKTDKKYKPYMYAILIFLILKICASILKKSIHKNR
jgi:hypothetical protein